jgi:RND family efflux transporter MFP subunit
MKTARFVTSSLGLAALMLLAACGDSGNQPAQKAAATSVVPAAAAAPSGSAPSEFLASGPIVVENQLDIQALRDGVVSDISADLGTRVKKGAVLARLDDRQVLADRDAAQAKEKSLEADVQGWIYETKVLQSDLDRAEAMSKAQLITPQELDHARYKVQADKYETERSRQNLVNAQDALKSLNLELEKTRIVAPFDGVVARRYVRAGQKVAVGDRLFWITATAPLRLRFTLPERFAGHVNVGQQLAVTLANADQKTESRVVSVSPVVDPASGTIEVVTELVKPASEVRPGMTANVHLPEPR